MRIDFDPVKREAMLAERGLDFADAPKLFAGLSYTREDDRFAYPEALPDLRPAGGTDGDGGVGGDRDRPPHHLDEEMQ